ncbi:MAG TPA: aminomethyl-transferring glycine dehydrogenase subunit GcvPA [Gammaproteobacteria bacterium]|nr:aminomethyl-transferring glycine dehydrogenase subunit GcvPA [Gammaproteobacteria bacterium]
MPFIPHTEQEIQDMLQTIGVSDFDALIDEIPKEMRLKRLENIPKGMSEMEIAKLMRDRAAQDGHPLCFLGAGAYEHHIPAAVWEIATRGEYYSAYTPYQAEASQGTLQLIYEYQTMMANLTGLDASNASLYDGASALAEAVLMAVRANRRSKSKRVLIPRTVHPAYLRAAKTLVGNQGIALETLPFDHKTGSTPVNALPASPGNIAAVVIPQPNFFGVMEDVDALTDWAHAHGALAIGLVNPMAAALLKPPGQWGAKGADIACGEGQPLGIPLSSGGPYFGFMCCRKEHIRQMPGRIVGRTRDLNGKRGFVLTLQAREQHIRRSKATSNICTNQGLMVTAATIYMALLGGQGLRRVAMASHHNTAALVQRLTRLHGVECAFDRPYLHEAVLRLDRPVDDVLAGLAKANLLGGYDLSRDYPELGHSMLICVTETKSEADLDVYATNLQRVLEGRKVANS